jgi:hypothetical protein
MTMGRKPSASPVCYAEDPEIDPAYMWAQPAPKPKAKRKGGAKAESAPPPRKPAKRSGKR